MLIMVVLSLLFLGISIGTYISNLPEVKWIGVVGILGFSSLLIVSLVLTIR